MLDELEQHLPVGARPRTPKPATFNLELKNVERLATLAEEMKCNKSAVVNALIKQAYVSSFEEE